jgi:hypothetical protein
MVVVNGCQEDRACTEQNECKLKDWFGMFAKASSVVDDSIFTTRHWHWVVPKIAIRPHGVPNVFIILVIVNPQQVLLRKPESTFVERAFSDVDDR